jgi:phage shock protein PspC (stress-responsive transcriptional regulator)
MSEPARRLQRSRSNKMVAGVAGGIAEYANVDPLLVRVVLAALTIFGGAGLLIYALGWLLLPAADSRYSIAESLIGRGTRARPVVLAILLSVAVIALAENTLHGDRSNFLLALIAVGGGLLIYRHLDHRGVTRHEQPTVEEPTDDVPLLSAPMTYSGDLASQSMEAVNRAADRLAAEQLAEDDRAIYLQPEPEEPVGERPQPHRPRRYTGAITFCALLVAVGLFGGLDRLGAVSLAPRDFLGLALAVVGVGLIVGAFRGGSRGLIVLGVPLTVLVLAASVVPWDRHADVGRHEIQPTSVADVAPQYVLNIGEEGLDFSGVDFAGHTVNTFVQVGVGQIDVTVPRNVDVTVYGRVRLGDLRLFDAHGSGVSDITKIDNGPDGPGGGRLNLTLNAGIGHVEVHRVP